MNSTCRTAIAAAVAGGYVLGRTRKAKAAFAIGTLLAGRRFGLTPTALAGEGLRRLRESPQLAGLREQIGGDLMDAARAAASASADRRFSAFAGTLRDRAGTKDTGEEPEDETYDEPDDGEAYEDREGERDEDEGGGGDERADRSAARRRGPGHERRRSGKGKGTAQQAAKKSAKKAAPAGRATAKKARPATKTASKKAASGRSHATGTRRGR